MSAVAQPGKPDERLLRTALERAQQPILLADDHRRWVTANAGARTLLGLKPDEVAWYRMDDFTAPEDCDWLNTQWDRFLEVGTAEGWYRLNVSGHGRMRVEFSATANVLPSRHLMLFVAPEDDHGAQPQQDADEDPGWEPVASRDVPQSALTGREREVLTLVAAGLQSDAIAKRLFVSRETIKSHVQNAMEKLHARTRAHAVAIALVTDQIRWDS